MHNSDFKLQLNSMSCWPNQEKNFIEFMEKNKKSYNCDVIIELETSSLCMCQFNINTSQHIPSNKKLVWISKTSIVNSLYLIKTA